MDHYRRWLHNAARRDIEPGVVVDIAEHHGIDAAALSLLDTFEQITDSHGKSFFLIPVGTSADHVRRAALLTYVLNAGTDYTEAGKRPGVVNDFLETAYSTAEVTRIINRQRANGWSYDRDVRFVHRNGGRLMTTPYGILMGAGGNWLQRLFAQRGGTTWGDIFMVNTGRVADPAAVLRRIVRAGDGLALARLLHHEERHSAQWASLGYLGMLRSYCWELLRELIFRRTNRLEQQAGLSDGGYR
ncbi:hypothetical protein A5634_01850 [Mycobacterium asiaticum]|uniref:Uncharacterized protein n=1 Tax=Mycobacterium asiaticum TaxID=1790 RepID=A0A1A3NXV6_MYCAS|nr:hypothetical protein [Mycobacterium asiaticum]OBK25172.1 hypothetical protein A5634_01850 [Mycobacterium asiaticum]